MRFPETKKTLKSLWKPVITLHESSIFYDIFTFERPTRKHLSIENQIKRFLIATLTKKKLTKCSGFGFSWFVWINWFCYHRLWIQVIDCGVTRVWNITLDKNNDKMQKNVMLFLEWKIIVTNLLLPHQFKKLLNLDVQALFARFGCYFVESWSLFFQGLRNTCTKMEFGGTNGTMCCCNDTSYCNSSSGTTVFLILLSFMNQFLL